MLPQRQGCVFLGVIKADWDARVGIDAEEVDGHCFFSIATAKHYPSDVRWPGGEPSMEPGVRIGMLLDLGKGSMTLYKNDRCLGELLQSGLQGGEYRWAVSTQDETGEQRVKVKALLPLTC